MTKTIETVCAGIALERQAQLMAERSADADAWCGATEAMDDLLDDLCKLLAQQTHHVSRGLAPVQ